MTLSRPSSAHKRGGSESSLGHSPSPQALTEKVEVKDTLQALKRSQGRWKRKWPLTHSRPSGAHKRVGTKLPALRRSQEKWKWKGQQTLS